MTVDLLDKYTTGSTAREDGRVTPKQPYRAYGTDQSKNRQLRFDVRCKDGSGLVMSYSYLVRMQYTGSQFLSIICTDCIVTFQGSKLDVLRGLIHDEKIRYVQEYNASTFSEPNSDNPIIKKIEIFEMHSLPSKSNKKQRD